MNKRNKIILIGLFIFFMFALMIGIYLFPDEEPMVVNKGEVTAEKIPPQQSNQPDAVIGKKPPTVSPANTAPQAAAGASKVNPYVSYPEALFELLGIDMEQLVKERETFKSTVIHVEWMDHINEILKNLDPEKKNAIIKNHTSLLYIKDKLNEAYLTGKIDHETFIKALGDLMKWHQKSYESILTGAEYEALFEIQPDKVDDAIDALLEAAPEYSFILNQSITVDAVKDQVQGYKLEEVNSHFKKMALDQETIGKQIGSGKLSLEQAREALNKSQQAFIAQCKNILTEDEINTIFGSVTALETGATQTEAPAVLGDTDEMELGFKIDNQETSIENVTEKIDKNKIEDIKFFYEQRKMEREELISRLDAGEIKPEEVENISNEMDAAFEENCRSTLTNEEYQLLFGTSDNKEPVESPVPETLKELTEQEVTQENTANEKKAEE